MIICAARDGHGPAGPVLSRESLLLVNNVMLAAACGAVLLGTLYPLALDALVSFAENRLLVWRPAQGETDLL